MRHCRGDIANETNLPKSVGTIKQGIPEALFLVTPPFARWVSQCRDNDGLLEYALEAFFGSIGRRCFS